METLPQTNKTHHPEASGSSPPTCTSRGLRPLPIARLSPPPSTSGHVPLAAPFTQGPALNLWPPGAKLEARAARTPGGGEPRRAPGPVPSAARTMTCYRGFLLGSCRRVAGGRAAALRGPSAGGPGARPRLGGDGGGRRHLGHLAQGPPRELAGCGSRPDGGFRPSRVVVVAKTTRYEFEQQRYRYAELSEEDLKQLVGPSPSCLRRELLPAAPRMLCLPPGGPHAAWLRSWAPSPLGVGASERGAGQRGHSPRRAPQGGAFRKPGVGPRGRPRSEGVRDSLVPSPPHPPTGSSDHGPKAGRLVTDAPRRAPQGAPGELDPGAAARAREADTPPRLGRPRPARSGGSGRALSAGRGRQAGLRRRVWRAHVCGAGESEGENLTWNICY